MPRQGWETNKAGGKGPAAAGESDKSQLQPGCFCIPFPTPQQCCCARGWGSARCHAALLPACPLPRSPRSHHQPLAAAMGLSPASAGVGTGSQQGTRHPGGREHRVCTRCYPGLGLAWGWAALGQEGRAWLRLLRGRVGAQAGRAGWQADG